MSIETQSKISILSKAAILCGEKPITSLSEDRYAVTVGAALFELYFENEVQSGSWRFATAKRALSRLSTTPLNQWQYAFQIPADCLIPVGVYPRQPYEIYGSHIYTNATSLDLEYRVKPNVSQLPAYFSLLMAYRLAADMIKPITESDDAVDIMERKYRLQRNLALYADAQGRPNPQIVDSPFTDIRP